MSPKESKVVEKSLKLSYLSQDQLPSKGFKNIKSESNQSRDRAEAIRTCILLLALNRQGGMKRSTALERV